MLKISYKFSFLFNHLKIFLLIFLTWNIFFIDVQISMLYDIIISFLIFYLSYKLEILSNDSLIVRFEFLKYIYNLVKNIIISSFNVIKIIFSKKILSNPETQIINIGKPNKQKRILLANLITMTPGTFVISSENNEFLIHTIDKNAFNINKNKKIMKLIKD